MANGQDGGGRNVAAGFNVGWYPTEGTKSLCRHQMSGQLTKKIYCHGNKKCTCFSQKCIFFLRISKKSSNFAAKILKGDKL